MAKQRLPKFFWIGLLIAFILLLLCLIFYYPYHGGKTEFNNYLADISQLEPGTYTVTMGVYGDGTSNLEINDPNTQKQILHQLSSVSYDGLDRFPALITTEDHVYWLTFFSSEPFFTVTLEIGGSGSRNCVLGEKHRLRMTNTDDFYALLAQIEASYP